MRFTPKSEQEIQSINLIPHGIYSFEVLDAKERKSKSNNDMIELKLKIWGEDGKEHIIFDYLIESMAYKLRHFANVTGLMDKYENGNITEYDCRGKMGAAEIIIQKGNEKPDGGHYPDKNSVKDYVIPLFDKKENDSNKFKDDDLPF